MNLIDLLHSKLELIRLENRYTKNRHRRSTFYSEALYVDGEYVQPQPSASRSSSGGWSGLGKRRVSPMDGKTESDGESAGTGPFGSGSGSGSGSAKVQGRKEGRATVREGAGGRRGKGDETKVSLWGSADLQREKRRMVTE